MQKIEVDQPIEEAALKLKEEGNRDFKKGAYSAAESRFTAALSLADDRGLLATLYCNRSETRLKLRRYLEALQDAEAALRIGAPSGKALHRRGRAELFMGRYKESAATFALLELDPDPAFQREGKAWKERSSKYARESNGEFDLSTIALLPIGSAVDAADYVGPIEVVPVPGKGRGLAVTRDVSEGELLFANRALVTGPYGELVASASEKLSMCSVEEHTAFFKLCDGEHTPAELPSLHFERSGDCPDPRDVDRRQVERILSANAHELEYADDPYAPKRFATGLFLIGSLMNHSCRPSTARAFLGDMMFVRAARPLKKGDEVTDMYMSVLKPPFERQKLLKDRFGFGMDEDRGWVEGAVFPEDLIKPLVQRLDKIEDLDEYRLLAKEVDELAWSRLTWLGSCADEQIVAAATRLARSAPVSDSMFRGNMMPAYVGLAMLCKGELHHEAALGFARVCSMMEENGRYNGYHVIWALEALMSARAAGENIAHYVRYARRVFRCHFGPGVFENQAARGSAVLKSELEKHPGEAEVPPGAIGSKVVCKEQHLEVTIDIGDAPASDVNASISRCVLQIEVRTNRLAIVLPYSVNPDAVSSVKISKKHRTMTLLLPLNETAHKDG